MSWTEHRRNERVRKQVGPPKSHQSTSPKSAGAHSEKENEADHWKRKPASAAQTKEEGEMEGRRSRGGRHGWFGDIESLV